MAGGGKEVFHYIDVFFYGTGLKGGERDIVLLESNSGRAEANKIISGKRDYIVVQPLTSDVKKNWGLESFAETIYLFHLYAPQY